MDITFTEEQESVRRTVRKMMVEKVMPRAAEIDKTAEFPWDVLQLMAENGIFALIVPSAYGGVGDTFLTYCIAMEEVARVCGTSSMILGNQSLGSAPFILWGNEEQKQKYLPGVATGEVLPSFALTEPNAGSDVDAIQTRAVPDGNEYVISGTKIFITHANIATVYCVFAKVPVGDEEKLTCFIVDRDSPGVSIGKIEDKMGLRGSPTCELIFDEVRVPKENILGEVGKGFKIAMDCLDKGRISVACQAVGLAQGALDAAKEYSKNRVQFGVPICQHQAIQMMLADMETKIQSARWLAYVAAVKYDKKDRDMVKFSAMSKMWATDVVMEVTTNAVQIFGGYGYCKEYPVERMMRDAKVFAIFEGTNQIQRMVVARQLLKE